MISADEVPFPAFEHYPAHIVRTVRPVPPETTTALSRRFRAMLREAARGRPDLAGRYVLAQAGCGAGCVRPAAIDRLNGQVVWFPSTVSNWPLQVNEPLTYRLTSRLIPAGGELDERPPARTHVFLFDGKQFLPLDR